MAALRILLGAGVVFAMSMGAGRVLLRATGVRLPKTGRGFLEFVTGTALVSTMVFALAVLKIAYTAVFGLLAAGLAGCAWFAGSEKGPEEQGEQESGSLPIGWHLFFWLPFSVFGIVYLVYAMCPDISPDSTVYHVGFLTRFHEHHGFFSRLTTFYSGLAEGMEMLFWVAFAFGKNSAPAVTHLLFLFAMPFGIRAAAARYGTPRAGVIAGLLFYLAPVVARVGSAAYVDAGATAAVLGSFLFLEIWRTEKQESSLIPAGLLCGFAVACKLTACGIAIYAAVVIVLHRSSWKTALRQMAVLTFCALLIAGPWMVKNAIEFGNPFFPMFSKWMPNAFEYPMVEDEVRRNVVHLNGVTWSRIPWEITTGGLLAGILGPVFLLSPLTLLGLRLKEMRMLLLAFSIVALPYATNIEARFLVPALPFLALALALVVLRVPRVGTALAIGIVGVHAALSWPFTMNRWSPGFQWRIDSFDWRAALRITPEEKYLTAHYPDYERGRLLDQFVRQGELVLSPGMSQIEYHHQDLVGSFECALCRRAFLLFVTPATPLLANTWQRRIHFAPLTTNRMRIFAAAADEKDLRISEVRFGLGDAEIPRAAGWRFQTSANPWEIHYAFDGRGASWWTSGQAVEPGMWIEADFGGPVRVDTVTVEQNLDQQRVKLQVSAWDGTRWRVPAVEESGTEMAADVRLRAEINEELRGLGIQWIFVPDDRYGAEDVREHAAEWRVTPVGRVNGFSLWRLNR